MSIERLGQRDHHGLLLPTPAAPPPSVDHQRDHPASELARGGVK